VLGKLRQYGIFLWSQVQFAVAAPHQAVQLGYLPRLKLLPTNRVVELGSQVQI
jgi:hypothetical protein